MIICVCNNKNSVALDNAISCGAHTYCEVMKIWNCRPKCGKCKAVIETKITEPIHEDKKAA